MTWDYMIEKTEAEVQKLKDDVPEGQIIADEYVGLLEALKIGKRACELFDDISSWADDEDIINHALDACTEIRKMREASCLKL